MDEMRVRALVGALGRGSFSAAARAMEYSPAGISRLVDALEDELGVSLVERTSHGVAPTSLGAELLPQLEEFVSLAERIRDRCQEAADPTRGTVTMGCARSVAAHWIAPVLARFDASHPAVVVRMREGTTPELAAWLDDRTVDFCVGALQEGRPWIPLGESPYVALVPADHPFARRSGLTLADLDREPAVQISPGRGTDTARLLAREGIEQDVRFTTGDFETAKAMVGAGIGCCLTIDLVGPVEGTGAVVVPMEGIRPFRFGITHRDLQGLSGAARALVEELERHGRAEPTVAS